MSSIVVDTTEVVTPTTRVSIAEPINLNRRRAQYTGMSSQATQRRERAFEAFAEAVYDELGERVHEIILYGSTARGEATERSDVDILVVLESDIDTDAISRLAFDIGLEYDVAITAHARTRERFEARKDYPFLRNVRREGRSYG